MAQTQASCDVRGGAAASAAHPGRIPSMPVQASALDMLVCISCCSLPLPVAPLVMLSSKHVFLLPGQPGSGSCLLPFYPDPLLICIPGCFHLVVSCLQTVDSFLCLVLPVSPQVLMIHIQFPEFTDIAHSVFII